MSAVPAQTCDELARLGSTTVYEGAGREGLIDVEYRQLIPGSRACGPARIARCGAGDNLMVHAVMSVLQPGEVLVLTMDEPMAVGIIGDLLATQAKVGGAVAILNDCASRDIEELVELGLPIWTRYVRSRGATKDTVGELDVPVTIGGQTVRTGDLVVLDADGATVVPIERADAVLEASLAREDKERLKREKLQGGAISYDLDGLRAVVEKGSR